jgi:hypothetical protein
MSSVSQARPSPLVLALAEAVRGAIRNTNLVVDHALATGDPVLVSCACAVDVGDQRCVCGLSVPLPDRWVRAARTRRAARRAVGPLPRRRCALCKADDHDLAPTYEMTVSVAGHGPMAPVRVAAPRRRSARMTLARASRSGALPPEAVEAQKKSAGGTARGA